MPTRTAPASIDDYIAGFPDEVQPVLRQVRAIIRQEAPDAQETISYQIPTFTLAGRHLVYFAGHSRHVALYPAPVGNPEFAPEMAVYGSGKGTARFRLDQPLPVDVIRRIVKFRIQDTLARAAAAKAKRGAPGRGK
jgi:uncharacterized protein YdhG (YjbR/CyaY superfamily)